ncbi:hypothetical protein V6N13_039868 [Hibiscus sabdariffa]|uniref:Uncharacterized protein n=1 Tax=Hibiscus sabdariffa TaxID=183260 RepID=A0ABR2SUX2_9ROSI
MPIHVGQHHQPPELVEHVDLIDKREENISRVVGDQQQIYSSDYVDFSDTSGDQEIIKLCGVMFWNKFYDVSDGYSAAVAASV